MKAKFTNKGWFGLCPVYLGDVETESPQVEPRFPATGWLLHFSAWIFGVLNAEAFPIMLTGELDPPKWIDIN